MTLFFSNDRKIGSHITVKLYILMHLDELYLLHYFGVKGQDLSDLNFSNGC